jgi:hypothetical protein
MPHRRSACRNLFKKAPRWRPARLKEFLSLRNVCRPCNLYSARKRFTTAHIRRMLVVNKTNKSIASSQEVLRVGQEGRRREGLGVFERAI